MTNDSDASSKTEAPTPRKLQRARQQGQVARSRDLVHTASLSAAMCTAAMGTGWAMQQVSGLFELLWAALAHPEGHLAQALGARALQTVLTLGTGVLAPLALAGLLADWLQTGPLWSLQRLAPRVDHLNPLAGLRRMASGERWVEVLKSLSKTLAFLVIGWLSVRAVLDPLSRLPWQGRPHDLGHALWQVGSHILLATLGVMFLLSLLDWLDQRRRLMKRLRMTRQEVRQEAREQEGDPHFKAHRRQAHQAWSQNAAVQSARQAHVLLVNPTHVAVAVDYDRLTCPVPTVCAKGLDGLALAMREAAEEAGVPIVRNVALARGLHERAEVGDLVPSDLFAVMAEVILWAREARAPRGLPSKDDGVARSGGVADSSADG